MSNTYDRKNRSKKKSYNKLENKKNNNRQFTFINKKNIIIFIIIIIIITGALYYYYYHYNNQYQKPYKHITIKSIYEFDDSQKNNNQTFQITVPKTKILNYNLNNPNDSSSSSIVSGNISDNVQIKTLLYFFSDDLINKGSNINVPSLSS